MKTQIDENLPGKVGLTAIVWFLVFQSPLESVWVPFSYIDEFIALIGACFGLYDIVIVRKGHPSKEQLWMGIPLLVFIMVGLAGNLLYHYQPLKSVIIDLYTNLKFFFAIGTGYYLFSTVSLEIVEDTARLHGRAITLLLFVLFLIDRIFHIWPAEVRYGIPSAQLFYFHPTYLAGSVAFLAVLLTVFYEKKNLPFIAMALIIMAFTLRAKSLASVAAYVAMFVFFIILKWKLRLWHIGIMGMGCIAIAWDKIRFYFFELAGESARSVMLQKSFSAMKDHFPIGTGFGTYGSAEAAKHYSAVYTKYCFNNYYELRDVRDVENTMRLIKENEWLTKQYKLYPEEMLHGGTFLMDSFWPIIFGQGGLLGTLSFLVVIGVLLKQCLDIKKFNLHAYVGVLYAMAYLCISSMAEPAFHNAVAIPLAMVIGMVFFRMDEWKRGL